VAAGPRPGFELSWRNASECLERIGREFAKRKRKDRVTAFLYLQQELSENAHILVPQAISFKDLMATVTTIEDMLKGQTESGEGPMDYLKRYLTIPQCPHCGKDLMTQ
jgi:hypothetical protein